MQLSKEILQYCVLLDMCKLAVCKIETQHTMRLRISAGRVQLPHAGQVVEGYLVRQLARSLLEVENEGLVENLRVLVSRISFVRKCIHHLQ